MIMRHIALFRGINVGGKNKVEMPRLKSLFESIDYTNVATYINSGNIIFSSDEALDKIQTDIKINFRKEFNIEVPILIKKQLDLINVVDSIPNNWQNDSIQKTDVAFLFPEIDFADIVDQLPINRDYIDVHYTKGAIIWNVLRKYQNKSQLNKLASSKIYKLMTIRNINTTRYLADW